MISRILVLAAIVSAAPPFVRGDGLIYSLPPDGRWVTYRMHLYATGVETLKGESLPDVKVEGTFTVRSVGEASPPGGPARWIELESHMPPTKEQAGRIIALKMVIPVTLLRRGADPLADIGELYFWDRDWHWGKDPEKGHKEKLTNKARILYEIERFRQQFPFPARKRDEIRAVEGVEVKTPLKTYRARKVSYPVTFQGKLSGGRGGRWEWQGHHALWLSDDVPFGVVAVETVNAGEEEYAHAEKDGTYRLNGNGVRWKKTTTRLEVQSVGDDAKSSLPDLP